LFLKGFRIWPRNCLATYLIQGNLRIRLTGNGPKPERVGCRRTVLLVDPDLGFTFWLGQTLDAAGFCAIPAINTRGATELIEDHRLGVDILVIDPLLDDALVFLSWLTQKRPELKTIAVLPGDAPNCLGMPGFEAVMHKPLCLSKTASTQCLNVVQSLFLTRWRTSWAI